MIIPPIKIQGKKTKIVPKIMEIADGLLSEHPEIDTWVEPFLDSGVVAFNCPGRIKKVIVNDINPHIIKFYKGISDGIITSDKIREVFDIHNQNLLKDGYDYYNQIKDRFNQSFEEVIATAPENSIFYCDPPYYGLQVQYFKGWGKEDEIRLNEMLKDKMFIYSTWLEDGVRENMMINEYWGEYEIEGKKHKYNVAEKAEKRNQVTEGLIYPKIQNKYSLF